MTNYRYEDAAAGFTAGVVGTVLGFPFDTIKSAMQTSTGKVTIINTCVRIYSVDGIQGFYRGLLSPLVALTILNTVNFSSYNSIYRSFVDFRGKDIHSDSKRFDYHVPLAAMCVGPIASSISTPFELIKLQLQLDRKYDSTSRKYNGSIDAIRKIIREQGASKLYTGHIVNTSREVIFLGTYFTIYDLAKKELQESNGDNGRKSFLSLNFQLSSSVAVPLSGGLAGSIGWFISFPLDCIKSQIQGSDLTKPRSATVLIFNNLMKTKGVRGLYSGVVPSITRAFIASSSRFSAYETVLWLLSGSAR